MIARAGDAVRNVTLAPMVLRRIGKVFISVGVLVLLFLAYQLYGTNVITDRHQEALAAEFVPVPGNSAPPADPPKPKIGDGIALIKIPKIALEKVVVEGGGLDEIDPQLKRGPGHITGTALPGRQGNSVISGHRTTYGAPFFRLDELNRGDLIEIQDKTAAYTYRVIDKKIVLPTDLSVIVPTADARLTLTTCHPRYSARQRLIIVAELESPKAGAA
ncbi:MAG: class E sortase [Actinomycetota bacterium]